ARRRGNHRNAAQRARRETIRSPQNLRHGDSVRKLSSLNSQAIRRVLLSSATLDILYDRATLLAVVVDKICGVAAVRLPSDLNGELLLQHEVRDFPRAFEPPQLGVARRFLLGVENDPVDRARAFRGHLE